MTTKRTFLSLCLSLCLAVAQTVRAQDVELPVRATSPDGHLAGRRIQP